LNNKKEYRIVKYSPKYLLEIIKLYHVTYQGRKQPHRYFEHRLSRTPFGKPIIYLMKFKGKIIGFYAIHPVKLRVDDSTILAGYSYLTMTHPEHIGKGIFTKLAKKTIEDAKKKKYQFIFGFANTNSFPNFIKKLGFKVLSPINYIEINKKGIGERVKLESKYPKDLEKIWKNYKSKNLFKIYLNRNHKFLKWRYQNHTIFRYYTYYKKGKIFLVFKKYDNTLHIVDFFGNDEYLMENLALIARSYCTKLLCTKITMWVPENHPLMKKFHRKLFKKIIWNKSFFIVKILHSSAPKNILNINKWYYTMSDADHF